MKLSLAWTVALAAFLSTADAAIVKPKVSSGIPRCATQYGLKKVNPVPTKKVTSASTIKSTSTVVKIQSTTVTPEADVITSTKTKVITKTKTVQHVDIFTTTVTDTTTSTEVVDETTTINPTTTEIEYAVSTVKIKTLKGFTPLASSLPVPEHDDDDEDDEGNAKKRATKSNASSWTKDGQLQEISWNANQKMPGYPKSVVCSVKVVYTVLAGTETFVYLKTTTAPVPTITKTATKTTTTTSTKLVTPATSTITINTTKTETTISTNSITETDMSTSTETIYTATTTAYNACRTNNALGDYDGVGLIGVQTRLKNYSLSTEDLPANSAEDCCVMTQLRPQAWFYQYTLNNGKGRCIITYSSESCPIPGDESQVKFGKASVVTNAGAAPSAVIVGNGPCGVVDGVTAGSL